MAIKKVRHQVIAQTWRDELGDVTKIKKIGTRITDNETDCCVIMTNACQIATDYMYMNVQLNHDRDLTAAVHPHIHWFQEQNAVPNFMIQYRWQKNLGAKTVPWSDVKMNTVAQAYTSGIKNQICSCSITPPTGSDLSDIIQIRFTRDTDNDSTLFTGADPYTGSVMVTSFDVHILSDGTGSNSEYGK